MGTSEIGYSNSKKRKEKSRQKDVSKTGSEGGLSGKGNKGLSKGLFCLEVALPRLVEFLDNLLGIFVLETFLQPTQD